MPHITAFSAIPCGHCRRNGCRLCYLYATDDRYRRLWGGLCQEVASDKPGVRILVISSLPARTKVLQAWAHVCNQFGGHVIVEHSKSQPTSKRPNAIISEGVTVMERTFEALKRFPGVPLFAYNWDVYGWVWTHPRPGEYDYKRYGELLNRAREVWVPSECTGRRTTQWYGLKNWRVILAMCAWWEWPAENVRDGGYAMCALRHLPDEWDTKFEEACTELNIPYSRPDHGLPYEGYQLTVAHCRFLVSHLHEASTGGLTTLEGYYHGKPVLLSNSEFHGGRDYFGQRARYFQHGDVEDFKRQLQDMYHNPPVLDRAECRAWVENNFSDLRFVQQVAERIRANI